MKTNANIRRIRFQQEDGRDRFGFLFTTGPDSDTSMVTDLPPYIFQLAPEDFVGFSFKHFCNASMTRWLGDSADSELRLDSHVMSSSSEFSRSDVRRCVETLGKVLHNWEPSFRPQHAPDCMVEFYHKTPGRYHCQCLSCQQLFLGDKRALVCPDCQLPPWLILGYTAARSKMHDDSAEPPFDRAAKHNGIMRIIYEHYRNRNRFDYGDRQDLADKCVAEHKPPGAIG